MMVESRDFWRLQLTVYLNVRSMYSINNVRRLDETKGLNYVLLRSTMMLNMSNVNGEIFKI